MKNEKFDQKLNKFQFLKFLGITRADAREIRY